MKKLVGAYYEEAKWFHDGSPPNFEEYMKNAIASSGYMMVATSSLVGMSEDFATKEVFDWVTNEPLMVRASAIIARLMNDIAGHKVTTIYMLYIHILGVGLGIYLLPVSTQQFSLLVSTNFKFYCWGSNP